MDINSIKNSVKDIVIVILICLLFLIFLIIILRFFNVKDCIPDNKYIIITDSVYCNIYMLRNHHKTFSGISGILFVTRYISKTSRLIFFNDKCWIPLSQGYRFIKENDGYLLIISEIQVKILDLR
jgi:hypothetical protein